MSNKSTNEVLHYIENAEFEVSDITNCGIYIFSTRFYYEFGLNPFPESSELHSQNGFTDEVQTPTKE